MRKSMVRRSWTRVRWATRRTPWLVPLAPFALIGLIGVGSVLIRPVVLWTMWGETPIPKDVHSVIRNGMHEDDVRNAMRLPPGDYRTKRTMDVPFVSINIPPPSSPPPPAPVKALVWITNQQRVEVGFDAADRVVGVKQVPQMESPPPRR